MVGRSTGLRARTRMVHLFPLFITTGRHKIQKLKRSKEQIPSTADHTTRFELQAHYISAPQQPRHPPATMAAMMVPLQEGGDDDLYIVPESHVLDYKNVFQYGWFTMSFLIATWAFANCAERSIQSIAFMNIGERYSLLSVDKKKNTITYIMQLIMTTFAFCLQIYGGWDVVLQLKDHTTQDRIEWLSFSLQIVIVLYVWEIIYRLTIGWPLLTHHISTLLLAQLGSASFSDTGNMLYIRMICLMGMYATTEQMSFVALLAFRLNVFPAWQGLLFYAAAVQALVLKVAITVMSTVVIIHYAFLNFEGDNLRWVWFWRVSFFPLMLILFGSQMYAVNILYSLGVRCQRMRRDNSSDESSGSDTVQDLNEMRDTDKDIEAAGCMSESRKPTTPDDTSQPSGHACLSPKAQRRRSSLRQSIHLRQPSFNDGHRSLHSRNQRSRRRESDIILASYESSAPPEEIMLDDFRAQQSVRLARLQRMLSTRSNMVLATGDLEEQQTQTQPQTRSRLQRRRPTTEIAAALSQLELELQLDMTTEHAQDADEADDGSGLSHEDIDHIEEVFGSRSARHGTSTRSVASLPMVPDFHEQI